MGNLLHSEPIVLSLEVVSGVGYYADVLQVDK